MENNTAPKKRKWRLNLFDVLVICLVVVAAVVFLFVSRSSRGTGVTASTGTDTTVTYTIELAGMIGDTAYSIQEGDILYDRVERRTLGKVVSVTVAPHTTSEKNRTTGEQVLSVVPGKMAATIVLESAAVETDTAISVDGGFIVRAGVEITASGPGYSGSGYILSVNRDGD